MQGRSSKNDDIDRSSRNAIRRCRFTPATPSRDAASSQAEAVPGSPGAHRWGFAGTDTGHPHTDGSAATTTAATTSGTTIAALAAAAPRERPRERGCGSLGTGQRPAKGTRATQTTISASSTIATSAAVTGRDGHVLDGREGALTAGLPHQNGDRWTTASSSRARTPPTTAGTTATATAAETIGEGADASDELHLRAPAGTTAATATSGSAVGATGGLTAHPLVGDEAPERIAAAPPRVPRLPVVAGLTWPRALKLAWHGEVGQATTDAGGTAAAANGPRRVLAPLTT
jgi:hypothetical protein